MTFNRPEPHAQNPDFVEPLNPGITFAKLCEQARLTTG